jgi:hypothetical protein
MRALVLLALTLSSGSAAAATPSGCQEDYSTCKEDCSIEYGGSSRTLQKLTRCIAECQESLDLCANRHSSLKDLPPGVADDSRPARRAEPSRKKAKKDTEEDPFGDDEPAPRKERRGDDPYGDEPPANAKGGTARREAYRASESQREEVPPAPAPPPVNRARGTSSRAEAEQTVLGTSAGDTKRSGYRASDAEPPPEKSLGLEDLEPLDAKPTPEPEPEPLAKPGPKAAPVKPAAEPAKPAPAPAASSEEKDPLLDEEPTVIAAPPPTRKPAVTPKAPPRKEPPPAPKKDISEWDPNGD